ncbi:MAG: glycosyltransferase family 2 protein, partial [Bacteroidaceae bacterium]|nr:glycosyltransferase family 2 protein [Bacteroidaceae bacterium]
MPKVSIIIPCYNQAEFLLQALQGLQEQTLQDFECIIVDDGSTDQSAQIAEDFIKGDHRFRLIKKANGGTATARNAGLRAATGEYVQFLDADDELDSRKLELQAAMMDRDGLDMSYTDYRHFHMD